MGDLHLWKIYCVTEAKWVSRWLEDPAELTYCPNNNQHTISSGTETISESRPETGPVMDDGRPIVRADTRPLDTSTYFTMAGDTASGIGNGVPLRWDFSDDTNTISGATTLSNGFEIPAGHKAQVFDFSFIDPAYFKDGTVYFFDAPWGCYAAMDIVCPAGGYYPNNHGAIPASALGLPGDQMYSYAASDQTFFRYLNRHYMYGSCPMGDELNAEGCMVEPLPVGWFVRGVIVTPNSDNSSKGFASLEMYRHRSVILPGDTP